MRARLALLSTVFLLVSSLLGASSTCSAFPLWGVTEDSRDLHDIWYHPGSGWQLAVGQGGRVVANSGSGWSSQDSGTTGDLNSVWGQHPGDVWAVGAAGAIHHFDSMSWSAATSPTSEDLQGVWCDSSGGNATAVGAGGTILEYEDGDWTQITSPTGNTLMGVWGTPDGAARWAVGYLGTVVADTGSGWAVQSVPAGASSAFLYGVAGSAANDVYAVGTGGTVLHYDGSDWTTMSSGTTQDLYGVWCSSDGANVYAVGADGTIIHYNGASWSPMTSGTTQELRGVTGSGTDDLYAAGQDGAILRQDATPWYMVNHPGKAGSLKAVGGASRNEAAAVGTQVSWKYDNGDWTYPSSPTSNNILAKGLWYLKKNDAIAVGQGGNISRFDGSSWTPMTNEASYSTLNGVWGAEADNVFAVDNNGDALRYDGSSWYLQSTPATGPLQSVWGMSGSDVWAVGDYGTVIHYDGSGWSSMTSNTAYDLNGVWAAATDDVWAVGDYGTIMHYNGSTWSAATSPVSQHLHGVWGAAADDVWAVGEGGAIVHWDGSEWGSLAYPVTNQNLYGVWGSSSGNIFAVGDETILQYNQTCWVSGTVYNSDGTQTLSGVTVGITDTQCQVGDIPTTTTDASGNFTLEVMGMDADQDFYLWAAGESDGSYYAQQHYNGGDSCTWATGVTLQPEVDNGGFNFHLQSGHRVSGNVGDADGGTGLPGIDVTARNSMCSDGQVMARTDDNGDYQMYVGSGHWYMRAQGPANGFDYVGLWYDAASGSGDCTQASGLDPSSDPEDVDFSLPRGAHIKGHIADTGGWDVGYTNVTATDSQCGSSGHTGVSGMDGNYDVLVPAGTWYLKAHEDGGPYLSEWYDGQSDCNNADAVSAVTGQTTWDKDFVLDAAGQLSGTVTDSGGDPVEGISVYATALAPCSNWGTVAVTDETGFYSFGLSPGTYYVLVDGVSGGHNYVTEYHDDTTDCRNATGVAVSTDTPATVDFQLQEAGSVSGTVYQTDGTTPISGLSVYVYSQPTWDSYLAGWATTDANGEYQVDGIPPGDWYVETFNNQTMNYPNYWWTDTYGTSEADQAQPVTVVGESINNGKDFRLPDGATAGGTVQGAESGFPIQGVWVDAYTGGPCNGTWVAYAQTDASGAWSILGLSGQDHWFVARPSVSDQDYVDEWWQDTYDCNAAQGVSLTAGGNATGIDFGLANAGFITGTITDGSDNPIQGLVVSANSQCGWNGPSATTDAQGQYEINAPEGTWYVYVDGQSSGGNWESQWWDSTSSCSSATGVLVAPSSTSSGIDFSLTPGGAIGGVVLTEGSGDPVVGVHVNAWSDSCDPNTQAAGAETGSDGSYTITGLPAGTWYLTIWNNGKYYVGEYWTSGGGTGDCSQAEGTALTEGETIQNRDFVISAAGKASGHVTASDGGNLEDLPISFFSGTCGQGHVQGTPVDASGDFSDMLPPGTYYARASAQDHGFDYYDTWYDASTGTTDCSQAQSFTIVAGADTTGIDMTVDPSPAMGVSQDGTPIYPGSGSYGFGEVAVGDTQSADFTISNYGRAALNLTGDPKVFVANNAGGDFAVTAQPSSPVAADGGSTTFTIAYTPQSSGTRSATVFITSNDAQNSVYTFTITGKGTIAESAAAYDAPTIETFNVASLKLAVNGMIGLWAKAIVHGPGPRDAQVTLTLPDSSTVTMSVVRYYQEAGSAYAYTGSFSSTPPADGTYRLTVTDSAGRTATKDVEFTYTEMSVSSSLASPAHESYTGTPTPTLSVNPDGSNYYYNFFVRAHEANDVSLYSLSPQASTSVQVPAGLLQDNTPYQWGVAVFDNNTGPTFNMVFLGTRNFHTGTKQAAAFSLSGILEHTFANAVRYASFFMRTPGLAPWDIASFTVTEPDSTSHTYGSSNVSTQLRLADAPMYLVNQNVDNQPMADGDYAFDLTDDDSNTAQATVPHTSEVPEAVANSGCSPANNSYVEPGAVTFQWPAAPGTVKYRLRLYVYGNTNVVVYDSPLITTTSHTVPAGVLLPNSYYEWVVHTLDQRTPSNNMASTDRFMLNITSAASTLGGNPALAVLLGADADSDGDGIPDSVESQSCTSPTNPDSDGDTIPDGVEDANQNGRLDAGETNPCSDDSDGDTLKDNEEDANQNGVVDDGETDPTKSDTDGDGMPDGYESTHGLDPLVDDASGDLDGDGFSNKIEYERGSDPNDPESKPGASTTIYLPLLLR